MWDVWWKLKCNVKWIVCFFIGHNVYYGNRTDNLPGYCRRCFYTDEERNIDDGVTMPRLLNHAYCWFVEREWEWFCRLDEWLIIHHSEQLPTWWEY